MRMTAARKITGMAALEAANFLKNSGDPDSVLTGALLVVLREALERVVLPEELFLELPLDDEPVERGLPELERVPEREEVFL